MRPLPLSYAQERLWFFARLEPLSAIYNMPNALRLAGEVDEEALSLAFDAIVSRHESLRTTFGEVGGSAVQFVHDPTAGVLRIVDASTWPDTLLSSRIREESSTPFDLEKGPVLRVTLLRRGPCNRILLVTIHHIVSDGWSMNVFWSELRTLYSGFLAGRPVHLPELEIQYADFAAWQREHLTEERIQSSVRFWKKLLEGAPLALELPTDRPRPETRRYRGGGLRVELNKPLSEDLHRLALSHGATLFMVLLASYGVLLGRYANQEDIVVGTPIANRTRVELEPLIGCLINTVAFRISFPDDPAFETLIQRVRQMSLDALEHQELPFEKLVESLNPNRDMSRSPVFQAVFSLQKSPKATTDGLRMEPLGGAERHSLFDLTFSITEGEGEISAWVEYDADLFDGVSVERLAHHWTLLVTAICRAPSVRCSALSFLPDSERHQLLLEWSGFRLDASDDLFADELVEKQAASAPDVVAIIDLDRSITYRGLVKMVRRVSAILRKHGVRFGDRVALSMVRSIDAIVSILAIFRVGATYTPVALEYPTERRRTMLSDAAPKLWLVDDLQRTEGLGEHTPFVLSNPMDEVAEVGEHRRDVRRSPLLPAYMIYTSGSTGTPKGTLISHAAIANLVRAALPYYGLVNQVGTLFQLASLAFDVSLEEILCCLASGSTLVIARDEQRTPSTLKVLADKHCVSAVTLTPSLLETLDPKDFPTLQYVVAGGETLDPALAARWMGRALANAYGPTEATVTALHARLRPGDAVSIGKPMESVRAYIVDAKHEASPLGVVGEICLAGIQLALAYHRRPRETAERFIPDPFSEEMGLRMYCTGDFGRWEPHGNIEFHGRVDHQIKIRGFRVELGEIEAKLASHPMIAEAIVLSRDDFPRGKALIAYVTMKDSTDPQSIGAIRDHLKSRLPEHMVPSAFTVLDVMPRSPSGKVDRQALLGFGATEAEREYVAPRTPIEEKLCDIFCQVLGVSAVSIHDDFFALGGHSLLVVRLLDRLRLANLETSVMTVFEAPTVATLAPRLSGAVTYEPPPNLIPDGAEVICPDMLPLVSLSQDAINRIVATVVGGAGNVQDIYPLTPLQEGILYEHISADEDPYVSVSLLRVDSIETVELFLNGLQKLISQYDILRTAIVWEGLPQPVQVVYRTATLSIERGDALSHLGEAELLQHGLQLRRKFDLTRAPLMRVLVARSLQKCNVLLLNHHVVDDHALAETILDAVKEHMQGIEPSAPASTLQFRTFVAYVRSRDLRSSEAFWRKHLEGVREPTLPFGLRHEQKNGVCVEHLHRLEPALMREIPRLCREMAISPSALFHAAFAIVLARCSGASRVVFGTVMLGRSAPLDGIEHAPGIFLTTLPLSVDVWSKTFRTLLDEVRTLLTALTTQEHVPIATIQRWSEIRPPARLFTTLFNYRHNRTSPERSLNSANGIQYLKIVEGTNYIFEMSVNDWGGRFTIATRAPGELGARCSAYVASVLAAACRAPDELVDMVDILTTIERQMLLGTWNHTSARYPSHKGVHQLFCEQADNTPDALAVTCAKEQLTYRELDERTNQLARYLRALGVGPEVLVGICVDRTVEMVVGLLGILKAGGAYVPLDPWYPQERINFMVRDAHLSLVLTQERVKTRVDGLSITTARLDTDWHLIASQSSEPLACQLMQGQLAYTIYTSGSTGQPKGVQVPHQALTNLLMSMAMEPGLAKRDVLLSVTTLSFDIAGLEMFLPLTVGGHVVIATREDARDGHALLREVKARGVTALQATPSTWRVLIEAGWGSDESTLKAICGGEALPPALARELVERASEVWNMYGPTETTIWSTRWQVPRSPDAIMIGLPIRNTKCHVLDEYMCLVPVDVAGELCIGGDGLARGYVGRPGLTAERFVPDAVADEGGARIYRTGDLVRRLADGGLEFLGRLDHQVKLRGFRIELGEIESQLATHALVSAATVLAREDGREARLVAYVAVKDSTLPPTIESLREHLESRLPEYMIPGAWVIMAKFPLTANGKLDRKALPAPEIAGSVCEYVAPRNVGEEHLCNIFAEVLGLNRVGVHDDFFSLGGHSLLVMQTIGRVRLAFGVQLKVQTVFRYPTVAELAEEVAERVLEDKLGSLSTEALSEVIGGGY
jgi:amino acid adenylation domain-containing protein